MRKPTLFFGIVVALLFAGVALAGGINLDPSKHYEFTNCPIAGSTAVTVPGGTYLVRAIDETVSVCFAESSQTDGGKGAGCFSDGGRGEGEKIPAGMAFIQSIGAGGQSVSCSSMGSTGDFVMTGAGQ